MSSTNRITTMALTAIAALFAFFAFLSPSASYAQTDLSNAYVLPGVYFSYNFREGYRKYDGVDGYQHVENTNPFILGLAVGRRISIDSPRLRFQAAVELGRGSVKDLEFDMDLRDKTGHVWSERVSLHSIYWTGGLLGDAHLLFPLLDERTFFVSAGLGAHLTYFDIAVKTLNSGEEVTGVSSGMRGSISPSANLGCGIEYKRNGRGAACISYGMRFWQSAGYKEAGELFPMGVDYTEFFFSQSIQLQYLLPRRD
jgi:hypothetical protein